MGKLQQKCQCVTEMGGSFCRNAQVLYLLQKRGAVLAEIRHYTCYRNGGSFRRNAHVIPVTEMGAVLAEMYALYPLQKWGPVLAETPSSFTFD